MNKKALLMLALMSPFATFAGTFQVRSAVEDHRFDSIDYVQATYKEEVSGLLGFFGLGSESVITKGFSGKDEFSLKQGDLEMTKLVFENKYCDQTISVDKDFIQSYIKDNSIVKLVADKNSDDCLKLKIDGNLFTYEKETESWSYINTRVAQVVEAQTQEQDQQEETISQESTTSEQVEDQAAPETPFSQFKAEILKAYNLSNYLNISDENIKIVKSVRLNQDVHYHLFKNTNGEKYLVEIFNDSEQISFQFFKLNSIELKYFLSSHATDINYSLSEGEINLTEKVESTLAEYFSYRQKLNAQTNDIFAEINLYNISSEYDDIAYFTDFDLDKSITNLSQRELSKDQVSQLVRAIDREIEGAEFLESLIEKLSQSSQTKLYIVGNYVKSELSQGPELDKAIIKKGLEDEKIFDLALSLYVQTDLQQDDIQYLISNLSQNTDRDKRIIKALSKINLSEEQITSIAQKNLQSSIYRSSLISIYTKSAKAVNRVKAIDFINDDSNLVNNSDIAQLQLTQDDLNLLSTKISSYNTNAQRYVLNNIDFSIESNHGFAEAFKNSNSWRIRRQLVKKLSSAQSNDLRSIVFDLSLDRDNDVKKDAQNILKNYSYTETDIALLKDLSLKGSEYSKSILIAANKIPGVESDKLALNYLTSTSWSIRQLVAQNLSNTTITEGKIGIAVLKADQDRDVKAAASRSLNTISFTKEDISVLKLKLNILQDGAIKVIFSKLGSLQSVEKEKLVSSKVKSTSWSVRQSVAMALKNPQTTEAKLAIFQLATDTDRDVTSAAKSSLRTVIMTQNDAKYIKERAYSLSTAQLKYALIKIGELGNVENEAFIAQYANHNSWSMRQSVAIALGHSKTSEQAKKALEKLSQDGDNDVRRSAQSSLNR